MVQIAVLIAGVAAGMFSRSWRQAWLITLIVFVATSAVQTPMVVANDEMDSPFVYWSVQALTLVVGLGLARALSARRRRTGTQGSSAAASASATQRL